MKKGQNVKSAWVNSPQADQVAEYYVAGHTVRETAEKYGVTTYQVTNLAKKRRLTNGHKFHEKGRVSLKAQAANARSRECAEIKIAHHLDTLGFEYLGGYTGRDGTVKYKCKTCGEIIEHSVSFVRDGNVICRKCEHEKALARQLERKAQHRVELRLRKEEKAAERMRANPLGFSVYQLEREKKFDEVHICKVCGKEYTPRQYVASCGGTTYSNPGYCSADCKKYAFRESAKRSHKGRRDSHRHRAKKWGCKYDSSITLKKLVGREGLRCSICGGMCDWNDRTWSKYSGPTYPSIDHIVPMSKGGGHTWNNVQVAHIICNSEKGNEVAI